MKPHPRIRKTIKWGGAVVTVLLVLAWFVSGHHRTPADTSDAVEFTLADGAVFVQRGDAGDPPQAAIWWAGSGRNEPFCSYSIPVWASDVFGFYLVIPLWPLAVVAGSVTAWSWRLDALARRARLNLCPKCNYDRAGLGGIAGDAKCPECGSAAP